MSGVLAVMGAGAVTPVGLRASTTCAALRADISRLQETPFVHFSMEPVVGATVPTLPTLDEADERRTRLIAMTAAAVSEALETSHITEPHHTALILGVAEPHRGHADELGLLREVELALGFRFHEQSRILQSGNTSVFEGLLLARRLLERSGVPQCVVAGVDSFVNLPDLQRLESCYRLRRPGIAQGIAPGEGAAALLVVPYSRQSYGHPRGYVRGIGVAQEGRSTTVLSDGHPTGVGLHQALAAAISDTTDLAEGHISWRLSDINGEGYGGMDSTLAMSLFYRTHRPHLEFVHPADRIGEIGAGVGALLIDYALTAIARGYAYGPVAMCETSAEGGNRACVVISGEQPHPKSTSYK